ncbi:endothelial PAS domain-containing protein 1-like isoform X3 [Oncorhynchus mykiss]|uniref:endothelial PAS domain-containing protein 1-like isoform X3 n=1 Tax=Oncorhynchus mykiss TaxID=8022 RepID=UPI0018775EF5|nr:endothelial PAS domain-containing protein 1-like isoform X3 [Oncorhynchus mykiss]
MTPERERRRIMSCEAARARRRAESQVLIDMSQLLPLPSSLRPQLDKPSIIRLTISYLRIHTLLSGFADRQTWERRDEEGERETREEGERETRERREEGGRERWAEGNREAGDRELGERSEERKKEMGETDLYLRILGGFVVVVTTEGDMIYLSDNIREYMGLTQVELMGHSIYDFTHPSDHEEIRDNLDLTAGRSGCGGLRDFLMRMKCTVTHRGRTVNLRSAGWRVLQCRGCLKVCVSGPSLTCVLFTCQPLSLTHTLLHTHTFTSHHSMDMRFTYCDQRVTGLLSYRPEELLGVSMYDLCHTLDLHTLTKSHLNLCSKGQSVSGVYRVLVRGGGYMWAETHSAVISKPRPTQPHPSQPHQSRPSPPLFVACVTYILSGVEEPTQLLSLGQMN